MNQQGYVPAVVDDHLRPEAIFELQSLIGAPPVFLERFTFPGEDGDAGDGDRGGSVVLGGEDVAGGPADGGTQVNERFDQHSSLDGHVQRAGDADALQGTGRGVFAPDAHQSGHFGLGDRDFFPSPIGERDVRYLIVEARCLLLHHRCCRHCFSFWIASSRVSNQGYASAIEITGGPAAHLDQLTLRSLVRVCCEELKIARQSNLQKAKRKKSGVSQPSSLRLLHEVPGVKAQYSRWMLNLGSAHAGLQLLKDFLCAGPEGARCAGVLDEDALSRQGGWNSLRVESALGLGGESGAF